MSYQHSLVSQVSRVRSLALAIALTSLSAGVAAAQAPDRASAVEMRKQFMADLDTLHVKFVALAEAFPADKYAWRPAPGVRSVAEVLMHVASEFYVYTPLAYGATPSTVIPRGQGAMPKFEASATAKPDVIKHIHDSFAYTKQQLTGLDEAKITGPQKIFGGDRTILETSIVMTADLHEHLGQLIGYARMNGVKPPWSK